MRYIDCLQGFKGLELSPLPSITSVMSREKGHSKGVSRKRIHDKTPQHIFLYQQTHPAYISLSAVNPPPQHFFFFFIFFHGHTPPLHGELFTSGLFDIAFGFERCVSIHTEGSQYLTTLVKNKDFD